MVDRVLLNSSSIKVSKPGINVNTATLDDLLLTIDMRVGQILASGFQALSAEFVEGGIAKKDATLVYGPFDRDPDLMLWVYADDGYAYSTSSTGLSGGNTITNAANYDTFFNFDEVSINPSSAYVKGYRQPYTAFDQDAVGIYYIIYRKPFKS